MPEPLSSRRRRRRDVLARGALAVGLALGLLLVRQLYTSGAPLPALRPPGVYPLAALAALALAAWAVLRGERAPVAAAALALVAFLANDRVLPSGDTHGAALLPYAVVRGGTLSLDGLAPRPPPYWVVERDGRTWSRYPVAAPLLALPVYLPAALGPGAPGALPQAEKLAAALMAAASVGFVLAALRRLGAPPWLAGTGTVAYALGSPVLSTASQALWQHGPGLLALSAAAWCALRRREGARFQLAAGLLGGLAVAVRPTDALLAAPLALVAGAGGPRALGRVALGALPPLALLAAYQGAVFGAPWATGYAGEAAQFTEPWLRGLAEVLLAPTRGLLAFVPWAALGGLGLALGGRREPVLAALGLGALGLLALYARWHVWWGGWCYGPRLLSELALPLALGLAALGSLPRRWLAPALVTLVAAAVVLQAVGTYASRSPVARAVYDVRDAAEAMQGWRWPPAAWLGARKPSAQSKPGSRLRAPGFSPSVATDNVDLAPEDWSL